MKKILNFFVILIFALCPIFIMGQTSDIQVDNSALLYSDQIDSSRLVNLVTALSSDDMQGRHATSEGGRKAAAYIVSQLKGMGVSPGNKASYLQPLTMAQQERRETKEFLLGNFNYEDHYTYSNTMDQDSVLADSQYVFVNYGVYSSAYNDFEGLDAKGKVLVKLQGAPMSPYGVSYAGADRNMGYWDQLGAKAIVTIEQGFSTYRNYAGGALAFPSDEKKSPPQVTVNELLGNKLLAPLGKTAKQLQCELEKNPASCGYELIKQPFIIKGNAVYTPLKDVDNVVGIIEGTDLKNEYVLVSAHYDHLGVNNYNDEVYNGADDNASGVAAVLEIARVMAKAKKEGKGPRRTVVFVLFTAEELGLYGSKHYAQNPLYPLDATIANVNIDMLGRLDKDYAEKGDDAYLDVVTGYSSALPFHSWMDTLSRQSYKLTVENNKNRYWFSQSDQYSLASKGVPSVLLTSGEHGDYHKATDDAERIRFGALRRRTQLTSLLVWHLANKPTAWREGKSKAGVGR